MSLWKKLRHRIEAAALRFFAWLIPRLSRQSCVRLANALGEIGSRLDRRGRAVALGNVRCALGGSLSDAEQLDVVRASYRNFARTMLDLFWAPALARPENRHWLRIHFDPAAAAALTRSGGVLLTLHYGNWEYASLAGAWAGYPALCVAEEFKNAALTPIMTALRQTSGQTIIPQDKSMLRMLRAVKRGGFAALLTDLTLKPGQASTIIRAFGMEMCVSMMHAVLAQRGGARIVPAITTPDPDGGCTVRFCAPLEVSEGCTTRQIAQQCWDFYEPTIRAKPALWLWPYKHFRYKPRGAEHEYPFYSNESGAFEKLRRKELRG